MGGSQMKIKNSKGFTLIELLIVVAIIAILAAIAIPQFSSYRIRGYNSAATADLRNARTAEEAFFSDWQVYASSAATGVPGGGVVLTNARQSRKFLSHNLALLRQRHRAQLQRSTLVFLRTWDLC